MPTPPIIAINMVIIKKPPTNFTPVFKLFKTFMIYNLLLVLADYNDLGLKVLVHNGIRSDAIVIPGL